MPQFRSWLRCKLLISKPTQNDDYFFHIISSFKKKEEIEVLQNNRLASNNKISTSEELWNLLDDSKWYEDSALTKIIKPILFQLSIQYLLEEKHHGKPLDK